MVKFHSLSAILSVLCLIMHKLSATFVLLTGWMAPFLVCTPSSLNASCILMCLMYCAAGSTIAICWFLMFYIPVPGQGVHLTP